MAEWLQHGVVLVILLGFGFYLKRSPRNYHDGYTDQE